MLLPLLFVALMEDTSHAVRAEPTIPKPTKGQVYIDPVFGTKVKRLTDAAADGAAGYVCYYPKLDPLNANESKVLFYRHTVGWWLVYDMNTGIYSRVTQIFNSQTDPQPRWHPTDPNKIRFFYANELREVNLNGGAVTTLATFAGYEFVTNHDEGNWSIDGNRLAVCGRNWPWFTGLSEFFVFQIGSGIISPKITATNHNVDWVSISPNGGRFVTIAEKDQAPGDVSPWQWGGVDVYDATTMVIDSLEFYKYTDHADIGLDADGSEIFITDNAEDSHEDGLRHIEKYSLDTGAKTYLIGLDWSMTMYVSARNFYGQRGWALITTEKKPELCTTPTPFVDEIFLIKLDGSKQVRRLAHHRSSRYNQCMPYTYNNYFDQANGVISRSGRYVFFTSNWRAMGQPQDLYMIDLATISSCN